MGIFFQNKLSDRDSIYWDFTNKDKVLTLHYNTDVGISILPKALTNATNSDNQAVLDLSKALSDDLDKFNSPGNFVSKYFDPEPVQWRLRGDPHLWRDMKLKTAKTNIPTAAKAFGKLLHKLFKDLTGEVPQKVKISMSKNMELLVCQKA